MKNKEYLKNFKGIIHIGANVGQERDIYNHFNLNVIWVEAIPHIYEVLKSNIINYKNQQAYNILLTDKINQIYKFNISNNNGESSSILDLNLHKKIWPNVDYLNSIDIPSDTLDNFILNNNIDLKNFDLMTLDTQGSELLVLKGSTNSFKFFKTICLEVADFESYKGCCTLSEVNEFMKVNGFKLDRLDPWWDNSQVNYYDAYYIKEI